ncbi:MAPEG family protein [Rhodopila sp.]|uniref:MAPEG family protein n=1 Tax=Rhodopila sp. TaxID=2480087 RepID=UPI002BC504E0|nr:MAPEG family protein [Rhodopila sp.]HVZ07390.1 MAPEG family protein [Rhodopila sp.]
MTLADLMLLAAVLLTIATIGIAKATDVKGFDNARPRDPGFYQDPFRARALAAHQNGFEVFPFLAAAVILAEMRHAPQAWVDGLAVAFILLRFAYVGAYLADRPTMRSVVWGAGFACNLGIFFLPWWFARGAGGM